jgi:hypothetical protein
VISIISKDVPHSSARVGNKLPILTRLRARKIEDGKTKRYMQKFMRGVNKFSG